MMKKGFIALIVATAMCMTLLARGASAGDPMTLTLGSSATLQGHGLEVVVPVTVSCGPFSPTFFANVFVSVRERVGHEIARGGGSTSDFVCDGSSHSVTVVVNAFNVPFHPGQSEATASGFADGLSGGVFQFQTATAGPQEIRIVH